MTNKLRDRASLFPIFPTNRLRQARRARNLTQQELARRVGVTQPTISYIERGDALRVKKETMKRISRARTSWLSRSCAVWTRIPKTAGLPRMPSGVHSRARPRSPTGPGHSCRNDRHVRLANETVSFGNGSRTKGKMRHALLVSAVLARVGRSPTARGVRVSARDSSGGPSRPTKPRLGPKAQSLPSSENSVPTLPPMLR